MAYSTSCNSASINSCIRSLQERRRTNDQFSLYRRNLNLNFPSKAPSLKTFLRQIRRFEVSVVRASIETRPAVVEQSVVGNENEKGKILRVGLICGGPSAERGISLNSVRSVLDHIQVLHLYYYFQNLTMFVVMWFWSQLVTTKLKWMTCQKFRIYAKLYSRENAKC